MRGARWSYQTIGRHLQWTDTAVQRCWEQWMLRSSLIILHASLTVEQYVDSILQPVVLSFMARHQRPSFQDNAGTVSDGELASGKASTSSSMLALDRMSDTSHRSSCASERPIDVGRVGSWAAGFNVLLEDPAGLHTFSVSFETFT
ncbi:regulator of G-protein signaling 12 [Trichonephila clavipes]|nr:regulator of G-protein signaling 12 [Trichonephila clavipes]